MNRTAGVLLVAAAVTLVVGVALYSPRAAVLVGALMLTVAGLASLELPARSRSGQ